VYTLTFIIKPYRTTNQTVMLTKRKRRLLSKRERPLMSVTNPRRASKPKRDNHLVTPPPQKNPKRNQHQRNNKRN